MALIWDEIKGWHVTDDTAQEPMSYDDWVKKRTYLHELWASAPFELGQQSEAWRIYREHVESNPDYMNTWAVWIAWIAWLNETTIPLPR